MYRSMCEHTLLIGEKPQTQHGVTCVKAHDTKPIFNNEPTCSFYLP